jgi:hypothetical protein
MVFKFILFLALIVFVILGNMCKTEKPKTIALYGDSMVASDMFTNTLNELDDGFNFVNLGVNGNSVSAVSKRISTDYDTYVIWCGVNELYDIKTASNSMRKILTTLSNKKVYVCSVTPAGEYFDKKGFKNARENILYLNLYYVFLCNEFGFQFINLYDIAKGSQIGNLMKNTSYDGLHFNRYGYKRICGEIQRMVLQ